jgi:hypothetical protein
MVESHANSVDDYLIEGLSFKLSPGASYVTNRRSVSFFPSGSDTYSSTSGVKVIKIKLNGTDWLDPSTVKVMFTINNVTTTMNFLSGVHSFFRRLRVVCNGQIVEDIDDYNRVCEMFNMLQSSSVRTNDEIEAVSRWDGGTQETLDAGKSRKVGMKLCSGLLNQTKMLPIRYCPLEIELELVNAVGDAQDGSIAWNISDVQLKADLCTLDNALENSYAKHLFEGKALPINYSTYISQSQTVTDFNFNVNVARAVTRLKSIFLSMTGAPHSSFNTKLKEFNNFWHPMSSETTSGTYNMGKEVELHVQIGSKLYPEYPIRSASESFSQLRKTMGIHQSPFHSLDVSGFQYRSHKFVASIDTEKVLEAGFTGLNTRAGDLLTIKVKPLDASTAGMGTTVPTKFFTVLHSDNILEIKESGVTVFD